MAYILGTKLGMTQIFDEQSRVIPVTLIQAGPVVVTQVKTKDKEGYDAVQVGFGTTRRINKPLGGHLKKSSATSRHIREAKIEKIGAETKVGDTLDISLFTVGDKVKISSITKGRGFQGAVKRHGFHGMPASHGHHHVMRHVGSIGQRFPQHTLKGLRMAGHMGAVRQTVRGLKIVHVDAAKNLLAVRGAVPGPRGSLLEISSH